MTLHITTENKIVKIKLSEANKANCKKYEGCDCVVLEGKKEWDRGKVEDIITLI